MAKGSIAVIYLLISVPVDLESWSPPTHEQRLVTVETGLAEVQTRLEFAPKAQGLFAATSLTQ